MATAAFKSNSKRSNNGYTAANSPKTNPPNPNPPPQKPKLRRSLSVNALSRSTQIDIPSEFLNKRDNPLYWATGGSPADNNTETPTPIAVSGGDKLERGVSKSLNAAVRQRGRSVSRNPDLKSGGQKEAIGGRRRSLSRVNDNGGGSGGCRRGRSVSRAKLASAASESEAGQESGVRITYGGRSSSIRESNSVLNVKNEKFDSQISNWEDGISTGSLSEAEEKTIKAVYEQMKSFEGGNLRKDIASSDIYEAVRSEVRRAIADIQDDLQEAIQRNGGNRDVSEISPKLVKPGAVELVLDIRREYVKELEESQERARKLRSDLAIEEHRKQELNRILKETLPEPKTSSVSHRSRLGRKSSSERKKMSKRLTDEAMSYFDECVSISTFDSSDFSAAEEPAVNSVKTTLTMADSNSSNEVNTESDRKFRFSFAHNKPTESVEVQHNIQDYIKTFEKDTSQIRSRGGGYNVDAYDVVNVNDSLLFDKVLFKNRQESGSLHLCGGVVVPFLPFSHLF